jgi:hypothetical protein
MKDFTGIRRRTKSLDLIRVALRFFSGIPHPHLLGVCRPNRSEMQAAVLGLDEFRLRFETGLFCHRGIEIAE